MLGILDKIQGRQLGVRDFDVPCFGASVFEEVLRDAWPIVPGDLVVAPT